METAREAMIKAAMKGVRLYGLHGVRIRHISELADVLPSSIYGYFKGKDHLMQACFARVPDRLIPRKAELIEELKAQAELPKAKKPKELPEGGQLSADKVLAGQPGRIQAAFASLPESAREAIVEKGRM